MTLIDSMTFSSPVEEPEPSLPSLIVAVVVPSLSVIVIVAVSPTFSTLAVGLKQSEPLRESNCSGVKSEYLNGSPLSPLIPLTV